MSCSIRFAQKKDVPVILNMIQQLAEFEKLSHEVVGTEADLEKTLFGERAYAEVLILEDQIDSQIIPAGMALFFHNYSTFLAKPGIYLEDLFVLPHLRGRGYGRKLLSKLAQLTIERNCGRLDWAVLDWNVDAVRFYESFGSKSLNEWTGFRLTGDALRKFASEFSN